jgi:hypothetical protein
MGFSMVFPPHILNLGFSLGDVLRIAAITVPDPIDPLGSSKQRLFFGAEANYIVIPK